MRNIFLDKLHDEQIKILDDIKRICDKNNIQYFLMYGTLLGAIRHKDFIPWDDDIDIAMPREDYEKFIKIANNELNKPYILDNITTNKKYYLPFIKIRNSKTIFNEKNLKNYNGNKGIYVDIFPLDYVNDVETTKFKIIFKLISTLSKILSYKNIKLYKKNVIFNTLIFMTKIIPNKLIFQTINYLVKLVSIPRKAKYMVSLCGLTEIDNSNFKTVDILPTKKIKFHNKYYMGVNNSDNILTKLYGNYLEMPPIDKRITHNPVSIKFSDSEEVFFERCDKN